MPPRSARGIVVRRTCYGVRRVDHQPFLFSIDQCPIFILCRGDYSISVLSSLRLKTRTPQSHGGRTRQTYETNANSGGGNGVFVGLPSKGAVCLDGSVPGYHLHRGFGSGASNWLVNLEGGGWCNDVKSCVFRKGGHRGSSNYMERQLQFTGILSNRPEENPDFYNWNRVKIRYCDGGSFTGDGADLRGVELKLKEQSIPVFSSFNKVLPLKQLIPKSERQDTWYANNSPRLGNKRVAEAVGDWFFERGNAKYTDCAYPCDGQSAFDVSAKRSLHYFLNIDSFHWIMSLIMYLSISSPMRITYGLVQTTEYAAHIKDVFGYLAHSGSGSEVVNSLVARGTGDVVNLRENCGSTKILRDPRHPVTDHGLVRLASFLIIDAAAEEKRMLLLMAPKGMDTVGLPGEARRTSAPAAAVREEKKDSM
ncbi:hypothetical protein PR202_ga29050 [Eleusine coracana subsp. coracana]|uniref:Pectin acetylesterase n=1 Tax=Eleusine coracana subsp. coracana TaxID=191504 RepID=A0AAV5DK54_ELECO|nr:hypothetical protein PR202_ga29050 [Eleusine coracana subsp. coracana]